MTVHFIGAGPGAPDLVTVRGLRLIERCPVCLYAGSLVPAELVAAAPEGARVIDTAPMHLDEIIAEILAAHEAGHDVARVHSGDPSLYGAIAEQMRRLDVLGIDYQIVPGVPAFVAAAAALKTELTLPEIAQTVIATRTAMKSSAMPPGETLEGTAARIVPAGSREISQAALTHLAGGDIPVDPQGNVAGEPWFELEVELPGSDAAAVRDGMRAQVELAGQSETLARVLLRRLLRAGNRILQG